MPKQIAFHGEFSSADASGLAEATARFRLYPVRSKTELSVGAADVVIMTEVCIDYSGATARQITVYDGSDVTADSGEIIARATLAQNSQYNHPAAVVPHECQAGTYPKVLAAGAGQVDVTIRGTIERAQG